MAEKRSIVLRVEPQLHQDLKIYVTKQNTTLQEYIVDLIKKDQKEKNNR